MGTNNFGHTGVGHIPCQIDDATFMPLLISFYSVDKVLDHIKANPCVKDKINPTLTLATKLLLEFHYNLGHLGFAHLKWILCRLGLFGAKGRLALMEPVPRCSGCLEGGMEKLPSV